MNIDFDERELIPILLHGCEEPDIDYKAPVNWSGWLKKSKAGLVCDMMAMANSNKPGYIVIGVTDDGGVVKSYDGLNESQLKSFDPSKIADTVKRYSDPEVNFTLYKPTYDGKRYVIIRISPFQVMPHICHNNCDDIHEADIYIRGEGARTIKVPSVEYMRIIIERAVQVNADSLIERIRSLLTASEERKLISDMSSFEPQISDIQKYPGQTK